MTIPICGVHKTAMTARKGGISKTSGNPYPAFWACPVKDNGAFCSFKLPKGTPPPGEFKTFNSDLAQSGKAIDRDKRDERMSEGQSWGNAKTNSVNWAIALYQKGDMKSDQMKEWIEKCANWIHNLEPKDAQSIPIKVAPPVTERELPIIEQIIEDFGSKGINDDLELPPF